MYPSQTPTRYGFAKLQSHQYFFQQQCQKPHLRILGSLVFWSCLTLSEPSWSASRAGAAALSSSQIDHPKNPDVTATSQDPVDIQSTTRQVPQATVENNPQQEFSSLGCDRPENPPRQLDSAPISQSAAQQIPTNQQKQPCIPASLTASIEVKPKAQQKSLSSFESGVTGGETAQQEKLSPAFEQKNSTPDTPATFLSVLSNSPVSLSLSTRQQENSLPLIAERTSQISSTPESETAPEWESAPRENNSGQSTEGEDPELGNLRLRESAEGEDPELGNLRLRESAEGEDPELGNLRLRE